MKHFYTLLLIALLCPLLSLAQSNYKPGLVVNLKGDTIHGFIDYREWENNPVSINFKPSLNGALQKYTVAETQYFSIDKFVAYQKYSGKISTDEINVNHLSTGRDTGFKVDDVFLKVEQKGMYLTLYSFTDAIKTRYFISEKRNAVPVELVYRVYFGTDGQRRTVDETTYKGQLIFLSSSYNGDKDDIRELLDNTRYNEDLVSVVEKINHFEKQSGTHKNAAISFFAGISSGITSVKPPIDHNSFDPQVVTTASSLPKISFGINVYANPDIGSLIFRIEASVAENNMKATFREYSYSANRSNLTLNQRNISLSPQVLYNIYNTNPFKLYVEGGVNLNFSSYSKNLLYGADGSLTFLNVQKDWFSIPLTVGVVLNNRLGIFVSYIIPTVITGENFKIYSDQIGITYNFGHRQ